MICIIRFMHVVDNWIKLKWVSYYNRMTCNGRYEFDIIPKNFFLFIRHLHHHHRHYRYVLLHPSIIYPCYDFHTIL